jgi:hypothetical protein
MRDASRNWPNWAPRVLWMRHKCPSCDSVQFKAAELRGEDFLLGLMGLRPVRCVFCWRRYYWVTFREVEAV